MNKYEWLTCHFSLHLRHETNKTRILKKNLIINIISASCFLDACARILRKNKIIYVQWSVRSITNFLIRTERVDKVYTLYNSSNFTLTAKRKILIRPSPFFSVVSRSERKKNRNWKKKKKTEEDYGTSVEPVQNPSIIAVPVRSARPAAILKAE